MTLEVPQLTLAYMAGLLGFLSPCSLPLMPSYVAYFMGRPETDSRGFRLAKGLAYSIAFSSGFLSVFIALGLAPSIALQLMPFSGTFLNPVIGASLIALGVISSSERFQMKPLRVGLKAPSERSGVSLYIFGLVYALASISCSLPIFLLVVFESATAEGLSGVLTLYAAYGLGAASLMVPMTLGISFSREYLNRRVLAVLPYVKKLSAFVLLASGSYMILASVFRWQ